jgi:hypothetical protein
MVVFDACKLCAVLEPMYSHNLSSFSLSLPLVMLSLLHVILSAAKDQVGREEAA